MQGQQLKQINNELTKLLDLKVISYVNVFSVDGEYYQIIAEPVLDINMKSLSYIDNSFENIIATVNNYYNNAKSKEKWFNFKTIVFNIINMIHWTEHGIRWLIFALIIYWATMMARDAGLTIYDISSIIKDLLP